METSNKLVPNIIELFDWNAERISRKAKTIQYTDDNSHFIYNILDYFKYNYVLFNESLMLRVANVGLVHTLKISDWLVVGEDSKLRFYSNEEYQLMYKPINLELSIYKNFIIEVLNRDRGDSIEGDELQELGIKYGLLEEHKPTEPCGEGCVCEDYYLAKEFETGEVSCFRLNKTLQDELEKGEYSE